jgi:ribosome-binding factor A
MDTTRQNKVSRLVQKEAANYFLFNAAEYPGAMVSVTETRITPDLAEARLYISIFPADKRKETFELIEKKSRDIRYALGKELRHQLRIIPELKFFLDDSLDYAERINYLLEKAKRPHTDDSTIEE